MRVIGIIGKNGSGKDALGRYLEQRCNIPMRAVGDAVRAIAREEGRALTRDNLHQISRRYAEAHGRDFFTRKLVEDALHLGRHGLSISGIRMPEEAAFLRGREEVEELLVYVAVTNPWRRFERLRARGDARAPETCEEFQQQDAAEEAQFHLDGTIAQADVTVNNDGTLEHFHQHIEEKLVRSHLACMAATEE